MIVKLPLEISLPADYVHAIVDWLFVMTGQGRLKEAETSLKYFRQLLNWLVFACGHLFGTK